MGAVRSSPAPQAGEASRSTLKRILEACTRSAGVGKRLAKYEGALKIGKQSTLGPSYRSPSRVTSSAAVPHRRNASAWARLAALWLCLALPPILTCGFPTDDSASLFVTVNAPSGVLVRGDSLLIVARTWQGDPESRRSQVEGVSYTWTSDSSVAVVIPRPDGTAIVRGVGIGTTEIRAVPSDYEDAAAGALSLRVTNTVAIDRVEPNTVRYGQQITLHGTGLGRITRVTLGEVNLIPDTTSFIGDSAGVGQQRFWVPFPATSNRVLAVAEEGFSAPAADSTIVIGADLYDGPGGEPAVIALEDGRGVLFSNPALALTAAGESDRDFHFVRADTSRAVTFVVTTYSFIPEPYIPTLSSGRLSTIVPSVTSWSTGIGRQFCQSGGVATFGLRSPSPPFTIVQALEGPTVRDLYLRVSGKAAGRFGIRVIDGYQTADPRILPDRYEENDYCVAADSNHADAERRIASPPFSDTLTIDNGFDTDWFRFTIPAIDEDDSPQLVTILTEARPFGASDSSDINLSLGSAFVGPFDDPIVWTAAVDGPGSSERISLELAPGDYYLLVEDGVGVATRYSLCIGLGVSCSLPGHDSAVQ